MQTALTSIHQEMRRSAPALYEDPFVADAFKLAMRRLASGVSVITTSLGEHLYGMTATAVTSLSLAPPSLLICINQGASIHGPLLERKMFCVNVLSEDQEAICKVFSSKTARDERFRPGSFQMNAAGIPFLKGTQASIFCSTDQVISYGTHSIMLGRVLEVARESAAAPLIHLDGTFVAA